MKAMASGVVPIVSDVGEAQSVIRPGYNGFLFPPGDVGPLVEYMTLFMSDDDRRHTLGSAARREAICTADVNVVASTYAKLLTEIRQIS